MSEPAPTRPDRWLIAAAVVPAAAALALSVGMDRWIAANAAFHSDESSRWSVVRDVLLLQGLTLLPYGVARLWSAEGKLPAYPLAAALVIVLGVLSLVVTLGWGFRP